MANRGGKPRSKLTAWCVQPSLNGWSELSNIDTTHNSFYIVLPQKSPYLQQIRDTITHI